MRKRDRYQSAFDGTIPGARSAVYDLGIVLWLLERCAKERDLLDETVALQADRGEIWTVRELLQTAQDALNTSVSPMLCIYERLQQNAEAMGVMVQTPAGADFEDARGALLLTLADKAIIPRGLVTRAVREIKRRAVVKDGDVA